MSQNLASLAAKSVRTEAATLSALCRNIKAAYTHDNNVRTLINSVIEMSETQAEPTMSQLRDAVLSHYPYLYHGVSGVIVPCVFRTSTKIGSQHVAKLRICKSWSSCVSILFRALELGATSQSFDAVTWDSAAEVTYHTEMLSEIDNMTNFIGKYGTDLERGLLADNQRLDAEMRLLNAQLAASRAAEPAAE